jgi:signal transduction histidine kinase
MADFRARAALHPLMFASGVVLTLLGLVAFNLGYVLLYVAFLPLLCISTLLSVEAHDDFFLSLLLLTTTNTLLYAVGLFALPLVACGLVLSLPVVLLFHTGKILLLADLSRRGGRLEWRTWDFRSLLVLSLFTRYVLYRSGGGAIPLRIGEFESLSRFLMSEVGGWVVFAIGYGMQQRNADGMGSVSEGEFSASLPSLLAAGLFLVSPYVAIMTLGLNLFGMTGLYVGLLPVGAAHMLMRMLTSRRLAIEQQNSRLQQMNVDLARSERLAAIGEMSSAISHQLLQNVGLVGLQCSLLRDLLLEDTAPAEERLNEGCERTAQLDESIADLNATLSDLLIFSKDVALHLDFCDLDLFLRGIVDEMCTLANVQGITIAYQCETRETRTSIDRIKMKQAVFNLLKNAVEASPAHAQVDLVLRGDTERMLINVSDQGKGIAREDFDRIFVPFFSTKAQGTGIGLAFAQKIVSLHNGTLTANTNQPSGATFVIALPRVQVLQG